VDVDDKQAKDIDMKDERLENSTDNVSIYHRYIETKLDAEWFTIKDAVKNQKYKINECWINALVDTYEGTDLTRVKRGRLAKTLSRDKVLELLEMSEEEFVEKGASINQMMLSSSTLTYQRGFLTSTVGLSTGTTLLQEHAQGY